MVTKSNMARMRKMKGKGFLDVLKGIGSFGSFIKDNKVLSRVGSLIPIPGVQAAAKVAGAIGLGKKKRARKQKGKGFLDFIPIIGPLLGKLIGGKHKKKVGGARRSTVKKFNIL